MKTLTVNQGDSEVHTVERESQRARRSLCGRCGTGHTRQQTCPAMGAECLKCGLRNHFARVCRTKTQSKPRSKVHGVEENISDDDESDMYVATIENSTEAKDWKATISKRSSYNLQAGHWSTKQCHFKENLRPNKQTPPTEV